MKPGRLASGLVVALLTTCCIATAPPPGGASASGGGGGRIAYSYGDQFPGGDDPAAHSDIYTVLPDGSGTRQLTHVPADATAAIPAWSPSGTQIAYDSNVSGNTEIWMMDGDGGHQHQVTHDPGFEHFEPSWAPDGRSILFERCDEPFGFLALCDIDVVKADGTGMRSIVANHRFNVHAVFSPDGKHIAFASDRNGFIAAVWVVDTDGSHLRQVTQPAMLGFWPDWSADGQRVVFSDHCCAPHSNVWSARPDGSDLRRITSSLPGHDNAFASVAPDGQGIVYDSNEAYADGCCNDLVVRRNNGSHTTVVANVPTLIVADWGAAPRASVANTAATTTATAPLVGDDPQLQQASGGAAGSTGAANPAHSRIAFANYMTQQLYTVAPDGTDVQQLTHTDGDHAATSPGWAPDGRSLTYAVSQNGGLFESHIWIVNPDGSGAHEVPGEAPGYRDYDPHFTPDGRQIVFSRCQPGDGVCAIWITRVDGTNRHAITPYHEGEDEAVDFGLAVSSDGQHVAFARFGWRGINVQVFVIGLDGTDEHAVTPAWLEASQPDYSPDGQFLAVTSQSPRLGSNVYSLRSNGTQLRRLTDTAYPNNDSDASFGPTGGSIAFASDREYRDFCCQDLFTMRADGSQERFVPTGIQGVFQVAWGAVAPATSVQSTSAAARGSVVNRNAGAAARRTARMPMCRATSKQHGRFSIAACVASAFG
jgi:Tol biopolymer transport system component